jgi:hypothetical protein
MRRPTVLSSDQPAKALVGKALAKRFGLDVGKNFSRRFAQALGQRHFGLCVECGDLCGDRNYRLRESGL